MIRRSLAMFGLSVFALAGVAAAHAEEAAAPTALAIGSAMPSADVKMKNVDGKEFTLAELSGKKGTLVVFSCNACPWAKKWEGRIANLGNGFAKKGVGVVVINSNDPGLNPEDGYDAMQARANKLKMKFPYVVDATSDVARSFGATRTPEAFLFDAEGKLVYHGTIDDNANDPKQVKERYLEAALTSVSSGKPVATAETKSMGCGIKFRKSSS